MAGITLADGRKVREIRVFINGRWYKTKGNIFHNGKWIEFSRPEIQFKDDFITTTGMRRQTIKTYVKEPVSIGQRTLLLQSSAGFYENEEVTITDGLNSEDVRIVGRNLVIDGNFLHGLDKWDEWGVANREVVIDEQGKKWIHIWQNDTNSFRGIRQGIYYFSKDTYYTVSFVAYKKKDSIGGARVLFHQRGDGNNSPQPGKRSIEITEHPKRYSYTFKSTNNDNKNNFSLMIGGESDKPFDIYITDIKFEKGTTPSPWTPAPEDIYGTSDNVISITPTKNSYKKNSIVARTNAVIGNSKLILPTYKTYSVYDIVKNGLILHLDGRTGKNKDTIWEDQSGNGNHGELKNFDFTEDSGWGNGGLKFDGVDDYVTTAYLGILKNLTVELTMYSPESKGSVLWTRGGDTVIIYSDGSSYIKSDTGTRKTYPNFDLNNIKTTLVITYNTNTQKASYYQDGKKIHTASLPSNSTEFNFKRLNIYAHYNGGNNKKGKVYAVRIYNRALTDEEIMQNYIVSKHTFGL